MKFWFCSSLFLFFLLSSFLSHITPEVYSVYEQSAHLMTTVLAEIFLLLFRVASELRWANYGSKHTLQTLFVCHFGHTYMHKSKDEGHMRTLYLTTTALLSELELYLSWDTIGELWIQTCVMTSFWFDICAHLHLQLKNYRTYMNVVHINDWCTIIDIYFSVVELDMIYDWWVKAPNTQCSFFLISH